jgi:hypothetical protein
MEPFVTSRELKIGATFTVTIRAALQCTETTSAMTF